MVFVRNFQVLISFGHFLESKAEDLERTPASETKFLEETWFLRTRKTSALE